MAGARIEIEFVKPLQLLNSLQRGLVEWRLPIESMQNDALQQIAQRHVVVLSKGLQHFEQALLHAHAGLHSLYQKLGIIDHMYQCTTISWYLTNNFRPNAGCHVPTPL